MPLREIMGAAVIGVLTHRAIRGFLRLDFAGDDVTAMAAFHQPAGKGDLAIAVNLEVGSKLILHDLESLPI
ncbi:MAG: hypothetical protein M3O30_15505, partial [Planctomycetota bacterium]|nr:hypothetical protein [Planctomycetota bacterium]